MLVRTRTSPCVARPGEEVNSERRAKRPNIRPIQISANVRIEKGWFSKGTHRFIAPSDSQRPSTRLRTCFSTGRPRVSQKIDKEIPAAERLRYQCFEIAGALRSSNHPPFVAAGSSRLNHSDMQCSPLRIQTLPRSSDLLLGKDNSSLARRVKNSRSHN